MKLQVLMMAVALATGSAFAAGSYGSAETKTESTVQKADAQVHKAGDKTRHAVKKQHAKAKHHARHAAAKRHDMHHAKAQHSGPHHDTRAMGAAAGGPVTDLNAGARQQRMDDAYAHWRAGAR